MKNIFSILALALLTVNCGNDDDGNSVNNFDEPEAVGLSYSNSDSDFNSTYTGIRSTLQGNSNISVVAQLDHSQNASSVNLNLRPTRIIFFGNPALGTPIMQENQLAGLDLPQHILVYQNSSNEVIATFNSTDYLAARFNVGNASTLPMIQDALSNIVTGTTENEIRSNSGTGIAGSPGIVTVISNNDFSTTLTNLRNAITDNENLSEVFFLDHQENASTVNMNLRPTAVVAFGNPNLGTPLMRDSQTTGLDLPQKMLVWQDGNGQVNISYNNPSYLQNRHNISNEQDDNIATITGALNNLAVNAAN